MAALTGPPQSTQHDRGIREKRKSATRVKEALAGTVDPTWRGLVQAKSQTPICAASDRLRPWGIPRLTRGDPPPAGRPRPLDGRGGARQAAASAVVAPGPLGLVDHPLVVRQRPVQGLEQVKARALANK